MQRGNEKMKNYSEANKGLVDAIEESRRASTEEEKLVKEILERTGYTLFIRSSKDLQDIAVEVESKEGFRTNAELVRMGESAELIKNFLPVFGTAENVPSDAVINGMLVELSKQFIPNLDGQLQVLEKRISFYKDIVTGNVDIEKLRGYIAGIKEDTLDNIAKMNKIKEERDSASKQYDGTLESLTRIARAEEQGKQEDTREFRPFTPKATHEEALALAEKLAKDKRENPTGISMDFRKKD